MEILQSIVLALHLLGMAAIVGAFFVQMRAKSGIATPTLLAGAIVQAVTGPALIAIAEAEGHHVAGSVKLIVHAVIGFVILIAAIVTFVRQRRHQKVMPWFHIAGGLAVINVLVAAIWPN